MRPLLGLVILATCDSRRFGSVKQIVQYQGSALLQRTIDVCVTIASANTCVVLGAHHNLITSMIDFRSAIILVNERWQEGISASIRTAVDTLATDHDGLLFLAAD